jgi:FMN reductase
MPSEPIRVVVVQGSIRRGNYTAFAARLVIDELRRQGGVGVDVIDPASLVLPLPGGPDEAGTAAGMQAVVRGATGVIFVTPEYHGSMSSVTKLIIDALGYPSVLAEKPIALVGVAAGGIGAIKALEHLSSVCSHVGALVLPGPVSVARVREQFDERGNCRDAALEARLRGVATRLTDYIRSHLCPRIALEEMVRERGGD